MNSAVVRARVDASLKSDTEEVFAHLGITTTDAIRMFLSQVRLKKGMPFDVRIPTDNSDLLTTAAMRQVALDSLYDD